MNRDSIILIKSIQRLLPAGEVIRIEVGSKGYTAKVLEFAPGEFEIEGYGATEQESLTNLRDAILT